MENQFIAEIVNLLEKKLDLAPAEIEELIEVPKASKWGDYAFPCFLLAKKLKAAPDKIAKELASQLKATTLLKEINSAGPYVNFRVNPAQFAQIVLSEVFKMEAQYGSSDMGKGKTVVIEFSSPNIAKPFGIGHLRSTVLGNSIHLVFKKLGFPVVSVNHLGDWGTQFGKLLVAYKRWADESRLEADPVLHLYDLYVRFHQEAEKDKNLEEEARQEFKKLEQGDKQNLAHWQKFRDLSLDEFNKIYRMLGIEFDAYAGESSYNPYIKPTIEKLEKAGLTEISQEALIVNLEKYNLPVCLILKKDEATLYATRDLAAAIYRYDTYKFHKLLYVVGNAQKTHFQQIFLILKLLGYKWAEDCVHVDFGWVKFQDEHLSTRRGNILFLEDVLDKSIKLSLDIIREKNPDLENKETVAQQVGIGAVVFAYLKSRRNKDFNFVWEEVLNFNGETGPYLQYTCARLNSLLRKYEKAVTDKVDYSLLFEAEEHFLVKLLEDFSRKIKQTAKEYEPAIISGYLLELASAFNNYYQKYRIITEDEEKTKSKILLVSGIQTVIKEGLSLLGISAPERM